jgi:hypothetical protein
MGVDARLLDHQDDRVARLELRCAFRPILPAATPRSDFPAYAAKTRSFRAAWESLPLSAPFPLHRPQEMPPCDRIIVGSDEVWNLDHPWYGGAPAFFGQGIDAPLLSYAASFGNQARPLPASWAAHLDAFSTLSVRDENSRRILTAATGRDPAMVLDPCLLFPPAPPADVEPERHPYLAVYGHNFPAWLSDTVRAEARRRNLRLVSIGYRNDWADEQRLSASPDQFAALVAGSQGVVTNFFHGCVFAILNGKPLVTAPTAYRANKIHGLLAKLGGENALVTAATDAPTYAALLDAPLPLEARLMQLRHASARYLRAALDLPA